MRGIQLMLLSLVLAGCADYQFTLNDRVIYSPEPLFADYQMENSALQQCLEQTILDHRLTAASQLLELICTHAGIDSLAGLETFTGLTRIKLSDNAIANLGPLAGLAQLQQLELAGNRIRSLLPLRGLMRLSYLGLTRNASLNCAELKHFRAIGQLDLPAPAHCPGGSG